MLAHPRHQGAGQTGQSRQQAQKARLSLHRCTTHLDVLDAAGGFVIQCGHAIYLSKCYQLSILHIVTYAINSYKDVRIPKGKRLTALRHFKALRHRQAKATNLEVHSLIINAGHCCRVARNEGCHNASCRLLACCTKEISGDNCECQVHVL